MTEKSNHYIGKEKHVIKQKKNHFPGCSVGDDERKAVVEGFVGRFAYIGKNSEYCVLWAAMSVVGVLRQR